jgi:ABC-type sugar transport system substrate-binding protein
MGKKWLLCAALLVLAVSVFAQGSKKITMVGTDKVVAAKDFGYDAKPKGKYTIAVVVKSAAIPVWESHLIAAEKAGKKLGVKILGYAPTKADNVEEQKRILEDLITTGVDAVILAPANTEAVRGPVQDLIKAGIPVIYDNTMGPSNVDYLTYVGVDNLEVGNVIAKAIGDLMGGKGKLLVLEGVPGQSTSDLRTEGVMKSVAKAYPGIVAERAVTKWQFDEGRKVTEDYITKWGKDLKAIVAVGGNQAEGAVEAVKAAGMHGQVLISGFDVQEPQYTAVANGDEVFTVSQGVYDQAYLSVVAAIRALNGESVPRLITTPIVVVTKKNLAAMDERPAALKAR